VRIDRKQSHRSNRVLGDSSKATALRVAQATFEGLAPLLIEHGITSPEVEALLRAVCVHAAAKTQTNSGRPNVSRVSVKTGVDRHVVAALLRAPPDVERNTSSRRDAISRVIDGWLSDPEYSDKGAPHDLDIGGPGSTGPTLWSVAHRYAPGVWPRLIVDELIRVDYVETLPNGQLRCKRAPSSKLGSRRSNRESFGQLMRDAVQAVFRDAIRPDAKTSWRTARSLEIDEQDMPLVRKMLRERLNTMFGWITDELNSTRWQHDGLSGNARVRVGVSGFTFEEILPRDTANDKAKKRRWPKT
jgi:hypothetical protein